MYMHEHECSNVTQYSLTPLPVELLPLNKVSMGCTAASTLTPVMVTVTPPLWTDECSKLHAHDSKSNKFNRMAN